MSTYHEGERVHFRPLEDILVMLETGYLELEHIENNCTRHFMVRKIGELYRFSDADAGGLSHSHVDLSQLIDLVEVCALDLHAFRWYPTLSSSHMGAYLSQATSHLLNARIDGLLASSLLVEEPKEVSICNH